MPLLKNEVLSWECCENFMNNFYCRTLPVTASVLLEKYLIPPYPVMKFRGSCPEVFCRKGLLKNLQNSQENTCTRVSLLIQLQDEACNFVKKETLVHMLVHMVVASDILHLH